MNKLNFPKPVKFKHPRPEEKDLIFMVKNYNEITNRCIIEVQNLLNWADDLKPQSLLSVYDLINVV